LPACTKHFDEGRFGEQISEGGYASAGFAEAVKMPRAEARGASLITLLSFQFAPSNGLKDVEEHPKL
jgi:hypothetical protein